MMLPREVIPSTVDKPKASGDSTGGRAFSGAEDSGADC